MRNQDSSKLVEKPKKGYPTRYTSASPDLDMKKQTSKAYKSRYTASLAPEKEIVANKKSTYKSRY
ncbi:MAG: hypothetical protein ACTSQE_12405 [Candidatus Heimdallarchaeaceae archaeon]